MVLVRFAGVAELADAQASGACNSNIVRVQVPSSASECDDWFSFMKTSHFFMRQHH